VCHGADGVLLDSIADLNTGDDDIKSTLDIHQRNDLKQIDEATRKITVGVAELSSALSDHDRPSVDTEVRDILKDTHLGHATKYDGNSRYESVTRAAELNALLARRNGYTWHNDFERNTRVWKLLVSSSTI